MPQSPVTFNKRTNEMSTLFDDPSGGAMEPMVVTRGEVDDTEEEGISGPDASSRGASTAFHSCTRPHLSCNFGRFEQALGEILGVYYRRIGCLAKAGGWAMSIFQGGIGAGSRVSRSLGNRVGGTYQLGQTVLDSIDLGELAVEHNLVISIDKGNPCAGRGLGGFDTKECV